MCRNVSRVETDHCRQIVALQIILIHIDVKGDSVNQGNQDQQYGTNDNESYGKSVVGSLNLNG